MTASRIYGFAQTAIFIVFAAVFFLDRSRPMIDVAKARIAGEVLAVAGLLLMAAAFAAIRSAVQIEPQPKADAQLVTRGVYRWLRHPIYTGILLVAIGLFLRKPSALVAAAAAVVIVFLLVKVRYEERLLLARYPGYAGYMRRSWGVIPLLGRR